MINISKSGIKIEPSEMVETREYNNNLFDVYWRGVVYIPGKESGIPSVAEFSNILRSKNVDEACARLYGTFFMVVHDKTTSATYAFVDNSGIFQAYYSATEVSDSFLELITNKKFVDISPESIVEFMRFGNLYFGRTFFSDIKKIKDDEIVVFNSQGTLKMHSKKLSKIYDKSTIGFLDFFKNFSESFRNEKLSIDLTGGFDTRLVVAMASYFGVDFEIAISGTKGYSDIDTATEVAKLLNRNLHITYHNIDTLEQDVEKIFIYNDGLADIFRYHRLSQLQNDRAKRGITLGVSGQGGELYGDFWWLQDFPFYNSSNISIDRLFKTRIDITHVDHALLAEKFASLSKGLEKNYIEQLNSYKLKTNTQTYDNIYYYFKEQEVPARLITNTNNYFTSFYAPLLELDLVKVGFNMRRRERFFNMFHRKLITFSNPEIAKAKTVWGSTVSTDKWDLCADVFRYCINMQKRLVKKIIRKQFGKTVFQPEPNDAKMIDNIRRMPITQKLLVDLKERDILNRSLNIESIPGYYLGRMVSLGLLLGRVRQD